MHIVHVSVHVQPSRVDDFVEATLENARNSIKEPGVARFDVLQQADDPTCFLLVEVYHTPQDQPKHRETAHYATWKNSVEAMMVEPRSAAKFINIFPADENW